MKQYEAKQKEKKSGKFSGLEREAQKENDQYIDNQQAQVQVCFSINCDLIDHKGIKLFSCICLFKRPLFSSYSIVEYFLKTFFCFGCVAFSRAVFVAFFQEHRAEQDLILDDMSTVLKSIGVMAEEMHAEIEDQSKYDVSSESRFMQKSHLCGFSIASHSAPLT